MTSHLQPVPTLTREDKINILVRKMTSDPAAIREVAESVIDGTEALAAGSAEIVRLRGLLGLPTIRAHGDHTREGTNR